MALQSHSPPVALILGHSFLRRLKLDLYSAFDSRASKCFGFGEVALVQLFGVGGRTIPRVRKFDLHVVSRTQPSIVVLELGTNDLSVSRPEVIGSQLHDFVLELLHDFQVRIVAVCKVIPRVPMSLTEVNLNAQAAVLNQYLDVVLSDLDRVFVWKHKGFSSPSSHLFLPDGVHLNSRGQYALYRSYRGAILAALRFL